MACDDRQLTEAQRQAGYQNGRTGVVQAVRPFSGRPTIENLIDYINRELQPAVRRTRDKVNEIYLPTVDNAPSGNPLGFYFSTETGAADPTSGRVRLNNATQDTATIIRVSESNGRLSNVAPWLDVMAGGATTPLGVVTLTDAINPTRFIRFDLSSMTDQGTYWDLTVVPIESSHDNPFVDGGAVVVSFIPGVGGATPATVPPTSMAAMAANTVLANATGSSAAPTAFPLSASTVLGRRATGNVVALTGVQQGEIVRRETVVTDTTSSGTVASYTIAATTTQVQFKLSGTATIHGMTATSATFGKTVEFSFDSGFAGEVIFKNESASAGATLERIRTPGGVDFSLQAGETLIATYFDSRWRIVGVGKPVSRLFPGAPIYDVMDSPFNAAGDGVTDDLAAINAAIAAANAVPGMIYLGDNHLISAGLDAITASCVVLKGRGMDAGGTSLICSTAPSAIITIGSGARFSGVQDLRVGSTVASKTGYAIRFTQNFRCFAMNVRVLTAGSGMEIDRCNTTYVGNVDVTDVIGPYGFYAHGSNPDYNHVVRFDRCQVGVAYPLTLGLGRGDWASGTAYLLGQVVRSNGGLWQCSVAGTSGASAPNALPSSVASSVHTTTFSDGGATWRYAMGAFAGFAHGSFAHTNLYFQCGVLQGYTAMHVFDDAGDAPTFIHSWQFSADHPFYAGVLIEACDGAAWFEQILSGSTLSGPAVELQADAVNVQFHGGEVGPAAQEGFVVEGDGVKILGVQVSGCSIATANTFDGIAVAAGVTDFVIDGCTSGDIPGRASQARYGISIGAGADNYIVTSNICVGNNTGSILNTPGRADTRVVEGNVPDTEIAVGSVWGLQIDHGASDVPREVTKFEVGELLRRETVVVDSTSSGTSATYAIADTTTQVQFKLAGALTINGMTASTATFGKLVAFSFDAGHAGSVTWNNESGSAGSTLARVRTPGAVALTISAGETAVFEYFDSRWRCLAVGKTVTGVTDGDKGDITVSSSGATWTIDNGVVSLAKQANLAQSRIQGRAEGAGTGVPQALTPAQVVAIIDAEDAAWTGNHSFTSATHTVAATGDVSLTSSGASVVATGLGDCTFGSSSGGACLGAGAAGHLVTNIGNGDVIINATSGVYINAHATVPVTGAGTGEVSLAGEAGIVMHSPLRMDATQNLSTGAQQDDLSVIAANNLRCTASAAFDITGMVAVGNGHTILIANVGAANNVRIVDERDATLGTASTAANRFNLQTNTSLTLLPRELALFWYDGTSDRWRGGKLNSIG